MNFLEQLVSEWYSYQDYYVKTNIKVAKLKKGGYGGEIDILAFKPDENKVVHIETSMDAESWKKREKKYERKFKTGREEIPKIFKYLKEIKLEQIAVIGYPRTVKNKNLFGKKIMIQTLPELFEEIRDRLKKKNVYKSAVPENLPVLRAVQFTIDFSKP